VGKIRTARALISFGQVVRALPKGALYSLGTKRCAFYIYIAGRHPAVGLCFSGFCVREAGVGRRKETAGTQHLAGAMPAPLGNNARRH